MIVVAVAVIVFRRVPVGMGGAHGLGERLEDG